MINEEDFYEQAYKKFLKAWGYQAQALMCIEEMSELTKALCKYQRYGLENAPKEVKDNVLEEIADVLNMAFQMRDYFGKEEIDKIRKEKIKRCLAKIK